MKKKMMYRGLRVLAVGAGLLAPLMAVKGILEVSAFFGAGDWLLGLGLSVLVVWWVFALCVMTWGLWNAEEEFGAHA